MLTQQQLIKNPLFPSALNAWSPRSLGVSWGIQEAKEKREIWDMVNREGRKKWGMKVELRGEEVKDFFTLHSAHPWGLLGKKPPLNVAFLSTFWKFSNGKKMEKNQLRLQTRAGKGTKTLESSSVSIKTGKKPPKSEIKCEKSAVLTSAVGYSVVN